MQTVDVLDHVGEYLKHAPNKKGGSKYKVYESNTFTVTFALIFNNSIVW